MLHRRNCNPIRGLLERLQKSWRVKVYRYANVGNHLHLLIRARSRADWQGFIRELSGGIAMLVTGARKGLALARPKTTEVAESAKRGFWDHLVYTRIVGWGRDYRGVVEYIMKNLWEAAGVPVRRLLERGFRILEISEDGGILIPVRAGPELIRALTPG